MVLPTAFRVPRGHSLAGRLGERGSLTRSGFLQHPSRPICLQTLGTKPLPPGTPRTASLGQASSLGTTAGKKHPLKGTCGPRREHPRRDRAPHRPLQTHVEFQDPGPFASPRLATITCGHRVRNHVVSILQMVCVVLLVFRGHRCSPNRGVSLKLCSLFSSVYLSMELCSSCLKIMQKA